MLVHLSFVVENIDYNTVSIGNCAVITVYMFAGAGADCA